MNVLKTILPHLSTVAFIIVLLLVLLSLRSLHNAGRKSTDELKERLLKTSNMISLGPTIKELRKRNEDYSGVIPTLLELATSTSKMERLYGWGFLIEYFPEITEKVEFDHRNPTADSIRKLNQLKKEWKQ